MVEFGFKLNSDKVFFTSDFHGEHAQPFLWESRGFASPQAHTDGVIQSINDRVGTHDHLFNLGDFVLNCSREKFEQILSRINCQNIYFLWGNHNSQVKQAYKETILKDFGRQDIEVYPVRYKNLIFIGSYFEAIINGQPIVMSHYPLYSWNFMRKGSWMLSGHEHCAVKEHLPEGNGGKILDVGWDYYKKPLAFEEIKSIMMKKSVKTVGHH